MAVLICAAFIGHPSVVGTLLAVGADIKARDNKGDTALIYAACYGHAKVVSMLLVAEQEIEARIKCCTGALMLAAMKGHAEVVSLLLAAGANFKAKDNAGWGALLLAAVCGRAEVVSLLLAAGADVQAREYKFGGNALMHAAGLGHAEVVLLLLAAGADIEAKDNSDRTALLRAAAGGRSRIVTNLISVGADANAKDREGCTPLIAAIEQGYPDIAEYILTHGRNVDVGAITSGGLTARDYAEKKRYGRLYKKLEAAERKFAHGTTAAMGFAQGTQTQLESSPTATPPLSLSCLPSGPDLSAPFYHPQTVSSASPPPVLHPASNNRRERGVFHSSWKIPYSNLQLGAELGRGSFAKVRLSRACTQFSNNMI